MYHRGAVALALSALTIVTATSCASLIPRPAAAEHPTPTATPTPTVEALPAVSLETTCGLLFGNDVDGPLADATDIVTRFVESPDLSTVTQEEIESTIESLETAGKNADESLQPYISAQMAPLQQLVDAMTTGTNSSVDFADFKASGLELLNQCKPYL